jgi:tetratricopeptide (TPR) repeat protein
MKDRSVPLVILLFILIFPFLAAFASVQGKIEGIVRDSAGNPLEKVEISIVYQRLTSIHFDLATTKEGKFTQIGLQPGYYIVNFKKPGYMPKSAEVKVSIEETTKIEVMLDSAEELAERNFSASDKLFLSGNKLYEEKKYEEAIAAYDEAIKTSPGQWGYYLNKGLAFKKLDKQVEARAAFSKAVELNPLSYSTNKEMGEALAREGNFEEAKKYYQKAVEASPEDPDAHYNLGACLLNTGEPDAALKSFQKCVALKEDYADAYYQIGTLLISQNKTPEAVQNLERFIDLAPQHEKAPLAKQLLEYLKK